MAELINEIVSPEAFKQVEQLKTDLAGLTKQMEDLLKKINTASPSGKGAFGGIPEDIKLAAEELKQLKLLQNQIITSQAKLTASQTAFGKEAALAKEQLKQYNAELRASAKEQTQAEGSLDQMRSKLNQLEKLYSAMSAEMRNAKVGQTIFADMVKAKEGVTLLEQSMGNYKRNVGNYQNSTFQLTQVLRELPAFTYSAQTGLMGISNNLPMLADAFKKVKESVGSTLGALKVFGASLFSFSNIFAIAIGAITMFLPQILQAATGTKKLDEATKDLGDSIGRETALFESLRRGIGNANIPQSERIKLIEKMRDLYPKALENYTNEEILAGKAANAINQIAQALQNVAMARAGEAELQKLASKRWENDKKIADTQTQLIKDEQKAREQLARVQTLNNVRSESQANTLDGAVNRYNSLNGSISDSKKNIEELNAENKALETQMDAVSAKISSYQKGTEILDNTEAKQIKTKKELKKEVEELEKSYKLATENINYMADLPDPFSSADKGIADTLKRLQNLIKANPLIIPIDLEISKPEQIQMWAEKALPIAKEIVKLTGEITGSLGDLSQSLFDREMMQLDAKQKKAQETYDAERAQIEQLSLSEEEKAKRIAALDAQKKAQDKKAEQERLQMARKQAAIQKGINIANIIGQTALAVITQFAALPVATQIPRAIAAGAVGAIQLSAAIAAPLPQFAEGTQNAPEGYAIVGERGTELVMNPDGTSWLTPAKDTLTYLKKGSKVIPNDELLNMVKNSTHIALSQSGQTLTPDMYGQALVAKFEEMADEMRALKSIIANKDMRVQIEGNYDHYMHVRKNIR